MKPLRGKGMRRIAGTKTGSIRPRHIWLIFTTPVHACPTLNRRIAPQLRRLPHPPIHSPTHPLTHRFTDSPTHRLTDSPTHRLTDSPIHRLPDPPSLRAHKDSAWKNGWEEKRGEEIRAFSRHPLFVSARLDFKFGMPNLPVIETLMRFKRM